MSLPLNSLSEPTESSASSSIPASVREKWFAAIKAGSIIEFEYLLETGGLDVDMRDPSYYDCTALHHACELGYLGMVKTLMDHGADINAASTYDAHPIQSALYNDRFAIAKCLLETGKVNLQVLRCNGESLLEVLDTSKAKNTGYVWVYNYLRKNSG